MKKLLLIPLILLSCKKKHDQPAQAEDAPRSTTTTTVQPTDSCKTSLAQFVGKYTFNSDTINVVFIKTNCPVNYSNVYEVRNFKKAMASITPTGSTLPDILTTTSNEKQGSMTDAAKNYLFFNFGDTTMRMVTTKLMGSQLDFNKVR